MKLYEFKALFMSRLSLVKAESKREKELKSMLMTKLNYLRMMDLPNLVHSLHLIVEYEDVNEEFKDLCREMLRNISKLDFRNE